MHNSIPWRRPREKDPVFIQMLIESTSLVGDIVLDCTAGTGASIHACRNTCRHIVALEGDKEIFKSILEPLIVQGVGDALKKQRIDLVHGDGDEDDDEIDDEDDAMPDITPKNRFSQV